VGVCISGQLLDPGGFAIAVDDALIVNDIVAKDAAGFPITLTDASGRLLSYQLLYGTDGGVSNRLSSIANLPQFTSQRSISYHNLDRSHSRSMHTDRP
jgi:hypothetical protein